MSRRKIELARISLRIIKGNNVHRTGIINALKGLQDIKYRRGKSEIYRGFM